MRKAITKGLAAAAALAAASAGLITTAAVGTAFAAGTLGGYLTPSPASGTSATNFSITLPGGAACSGDTATAGYKWATFMVASTVDPSTLTYTSSGPSTGSPLFDSSGSPVVSKNTAVTTGLVTPQPLFNFNTSLPTAGKYWIGYACYNTNAGNATDKYWAANVTIGAASAYSNGWTPNAPVLTSPLAPADGQLSGSFTVVQVPQAITGYTVTATPASGPVVTSTLGAAATSFALTGLVNGTQYAVTVTATNSVGSTDSNTVNGTPAPAAFPAVTGFTAVPGSSKVDLSWTAPADSQPRTGYSLVVTDVTTSTPLAGSPFTLAANATSDSVTGLTPGDTYSFQITAQYSGLYSGTPSAAIQAIPLSAAVLIQDVSVTRPVGALVMTQVCGANGALPARAATAEFPIGLPAVAANGTGTAPTYNGTADSNFPNYPYPVDASGAPAAVYPTHCGLNLGTATLITKDQVNSVVGASGNLAGQYFQASGQLSQITVIDTRDVDAGWTVNATMSAFTKAGVASPNSKQTFSGNHLGWDPQVSHFSGNTFGEYAMSVAAGSSVAPMNTGLGASKTLASATVNHGLGEAQLDARVELLVPVWAVSGTYQGTLTFSAL